MRNMDFFDKVFFILLPVNAVMGFTGFGGDSNFASGMGWAMATLWSYLYFEGKS